MNDLLQIVNTHSLITKIIMGLFHQIAGPKKFLTQRNHTFSYSVEINEK